MNKKIEDYLHLYLGCEVKVLDIDGQTFTDKVESVHDNKSGKGFSIYEFGDCPFDNHEEYYQRIMPILRPLSDMTDGEKIFIISNYIKPGWTGKQLLEDNEDDWAMRVRHIEHGEKSVYVSKKKFEPWLLKYLLSKGFDLFGLIEAGLAIETPSLLTNQVK
jgi:hypothetical protein